LVRLAERCLAADGGMPLATEEWFLRRRWAAPGAHTFALRAADGALLAAGAVTPALIVTGLVDPAARGRGLGARTLDHGLTVAAALAEEAAAPAPPPDPESSSPPVPDPAPSGPPASGPASSSPAFSGPASSGSVAAEPDAAPSARPLSITVETESLTAEADALFVSRGLRQFFAEDVMRIDLSRPLPTPLAVFPPGTTLTTWSAESAPRFHAVYEAAFRDRPHFPGDPAAEWIAEYDEDDEFRPGWSLLAATPDQGDVAFVTAAEGWIVQVGVDPAARGRGLAKALVQSALSRMTPTEAWLNVNVDNPGAAALYRRLGFTGAGRRARYRTGPPTN
jgi:ribosomal protein S18 acetylase RimI-like enzyme